MVEDVGELLTKAGLEEFLDNFKQQVWKCVIHTHVIILYLFWDQFLIHRPMFTKSYDT